jgi:pilus assembly protein CpaF
MVQQARMTKVESQSRPGVRASALPSDGGDRPSGPALAHGSVDYGPLDALIRDHQITDILINGPRQVYFEKRGRLQLSDVTFRDEDHVLEVLRGITEVTGRQIDRKSPIVDIRLPDGSRLNAVIPPLALNGPLVSIRRFGVRPLLMEDLLASGTLAQAMADFLEACVAARINIIISGGTGSGKTTLLNCLSRYISHAERVATIEDTAELYLQQPHVVMMESRPSGPDETGATMHDLVRNTLRMRPDRIIIGECRGAEALDMLQAMNTGHEGSLTTIHANSTRDVIMRLEMMIALSGIDIPAWAIRKQIASSVQLIVQVSRMLGGQRKVVKISEITGMEGEVVTMHDLFEFVQTGVNANQAAVGYFRATGIPPALLPKLKTHGVELPVAVFHPRTLDAPGAK